MSGLSTDLVRAFNYILREHTFFLAALLGVSRILTPWKAFLSTCTRSFRIRGSLSPTLTSKVGMPEGDALSVYAMVQLDHYWHLYMKAFAPQVRSLSFVGNLTLTSSSVGSLAQGLLCLKAFFELWNMRVDLEKSYCWKELGGILAFTKRQFTGFQTSRLAKLEPKWRRLAASFAPLPQKLAVLPSVFWAGGLYGIFGSCYGEGHFDQIRSAALKALTLNKSRTNSMLHVSLSPQPQTDPGYWRFRTTAKTFRRLARKEPALVTAWQQFMVWFQGDLFSGPFSQLLIV